MEIQIKLLSKMIKVYYNLHKKFHKNLNLQEERVNKIVYKEKTLKKN